MLITCSLHMSGSLRLLYGTLCITLRKTKRTRDEENQTNK